jgi:rubrerythrin
MPQQTPGIEEFIQMAIEREERAYNFYNDAAGMMEYAGTKVMLQELAKEELRHKAMLKKTLEEGVVEHIGADVSPRDIKLSSTLVTPELSKKSTPQDLLIIAMRMEEAAIEFYRALEPHVQRSGYADLVARLVREEQKHKERIEREYDEHYLKEM